MQQQLTALSSLPHANTPCVSQREAAAVTGSRHTTRRSPDDAQSPLGTIHTHIFLGLQTGILSPPMSPYRHRHRHRRHRRRRQHRDTDTDTDTHTATSTSTAIVNTTVAVTVAPFRLCVWFDHARTQVLLLLTRGKLSWKRGS